MRVQGMLGSGNDLQGEQHVEFVSAMRCLICGTAQSPNLGVVGEPEIVVGAEVQHRLAGLCADADGRALRRGDDAFGLEEAGVADVLQLGAKHLCGVMGWS